jgi:hypothetical protein
MGTRGVSIRAAAVRVRQRPALPKTAATWYDEAIRAHENVPRLPLECGYLPLG